MRLSSPLFSIFDQLGMTGSNVATWISRLIGLAIVWIIVYMLVRHLSRWIKGASEHIAYLDVDTRDIRTIDRLLDYITILIGIIISLAILGWTSLLYSALTAAGVFTVILGFAIKDVAANFVSGVFILIDRPFAPGDFIEVGDHAGTVKSIALRVTTLVTIDGPEVHIPNSVLAVKPTINYSLARDRRINFTISISNDADISQSLEIIKQVLMGEEGLLAERTQLVLVSGLREYAVDIGVTCYAPNDTWLELASDLKQQVVNTLQQNGIELAVPVQKSVHLNPPGILTGTASEG